MTEQPRPTSPTAAGSSPTTAAGTGTPRSRRWLGLLGARRSTKPVKVDSAAAAGAPADSSVKIPSQRTAEPAAPAAASGSDAAPGPSPAKTTAETDKPAEKGTSGDKAPEPAPGPSPAALSSGPGEKATEPTATPAEKPSPAKPAGSAAAPSEPKTTSGEEATEPKDDAGAGVVDAPPAGSRRTAAGARRRKNLPATRPPGAPPDPWTAFAAIPEQPPGRLRRATRKVRRALTHEYALATYISSALAVLMTWPALRYPLHTLPQDLGDPSRQAWQVSWAGHILITDPVQLWQSNAYFPLADSFAWGNSLLGYAPFGMLGAGPVAAVLRYNLLFVAAHALLALGAYALVRQLGARPTGAAVAAVAFAYAPWRLAQAGHLDIISAGGIPLALAMLARGHGYSLRYGLRPGRRHAGWAAGGWLVAAWQLTLGFSLGVPLAYVLGLILIVLLIGSLVRRARRPLRQFLHRPPAPLLGWRLTLTDTLGALIFAGVGLVIAVPYMRVPDSPTRLQEIDFFSPPLRSLLIGPAESRIWGAAHDTPRASLGWPAEMSLLPGFALYALALAGIGLSIWRLRHRLLLVAGIAVTVVLTLGTTWFEGRYSYVPLFGHYPSSFDLRIPGRLMLWVTLLLAVLAAGAVDDFVRRAEHFAAQRIPPWPGPWLRLAMLTPLILVAVEGWNATAHPVAPDQPKAMRTVAGPMLVLPTAELTDQSVQLWSTSEFQDIVNGGGTFAAARQTEMRARVASFPDAASIEYLRSLGVGSVLLIRSQVAGTPWERSGDIPVDLLNIQREDLIDAVLFRLSPPGSAQPSAPGQPAPGQPPAPGQTVPGQTVPGQTVPGQTVPGQTVPGQTVPGQTVPGQTVPGQTVPGQTVPGQPTRPLVPNQPVPAQTLPGLPGLAQVPGQPMPTLPVAPG